VPAFLKRLWWALTGQTAKHDLDREANLDGDPDDGSDLGRFG